jgi:organic radical activating enzyme
MDVNDKIQVLSLESFMTDTCNLRCEHCAASSPYLGDANLPDLELFERSLHCLAPVLHSEQIKFVGGEPLLNKELPRFMQAARDSGMFDRVRVTTNGVLLPHMPDDFWELADVVEISHYSGARNVPSADTLEELREKAASFGTRLEVNRIHSFMRAVSEERIEDPDLVQEIFSNCGEAHHWSCHLLYGNRLYRCSRVHALDRYLDVRCVEHPPFTLEDGLVIDARPALASDIRRYLSSRTPLEACSFCLGTSGAWVRNRQLSREEVRSRKEQPPEAFQRSWLAPPQEAVLRSMIRNWEAVRETTNFFDVDGIGGDPPGKDAEGRAEADQKT